MKRKILIAYFVTLSSGWPSSAIATSLDDLFEGGFVSVGDKFFSNWDPVPMLLIGIGLLCAAGISRRMNNQ